jgi:hypothetical protein
MARREGLYCKAIGIYQGAWYKITHRKPARTSWRSALSLQKITDLVHEAADQNGVPFVDLLPYVQGVPSPELWVTPPDPNPNGLAHRLFAQGIFEALEKLSVDETAEQR